MNQNIVEGVDPDFVEAVSSAWSDETAGYVRQPSSKGQCAITALVVQDHYGGKLIRGKCGDVSHYWNELPDGTQVDLTREQFVDSNEEVEFLFYRDRDYVLTASESTRTRYELLKERSGL